MCTSKNREVGTNELTPQDPKCTVDGFDGKEVVCKKSNVDDNGNPLGGLQIYGIYNFIKGNVGRNSNYLDGDTIKNKASNQQSTDNIPLSFSNFDEVLNYYKDKTIPTDANGRFFVRIISDNSPCKKKLQPIVLLLVVPPI